MRSVRLSELRSPEIRGLAGSGNAIAIIPLGSTEQHGPHLPIDVDSRLATAIAEAAAGAVRGEVPVVVAPTVTVGVSEHHMRFAGSLTVDAETFTSVVVQIGSSLIEHGFGRLVLLNHHAGNVGAMRIAADRLRLEEDAQTVVFANAWMFARDAFAAVRESGPGGAAHACEYETSMYLHLAPDAVAMELATTELATERITGSLIDIFVGGPYGVALDHGFSTSGVLGDATLATAEKGRACFEAAVANLATLLRELAS